MLIMVLMLIGICVWFELMLVRKVPLLKRILMTHSLLPIFFSVALSILISSVFGAAGLVVMAAGIGSTILMQPYYWYLRRADAVHLSIARYRQLPQRLRVTHK